MTLTYVAYVIDRPGVLNRVASLMRRRGYNIDSLSVGHSESPGISRMTLVVQADPEAAGRIEANLYKLVDVRQVEHVTHLASVCRDLALIKVTATSTSRAEIAHLVDVFRGRILDVGTESLVIEVTGTEAKVDGFVETLRPFGLQEVARTGRVAMTRGRAAQPAARAADPLSTNERDDSIACSV